MSKRRRTDDLPAVPAPHFVGFGSIRRPGRPAQLFLEKAAGIGRRIQEQHAGGFGAGVFPRMRYAARQEGTGADRKSTRLNSSHQIISYAVFCLKKKKTQ